MWYTLYINLYYMVIIMEDLIKVNDKMASALLPERDEEGNKGTFGCLLCVCGSRDMTGAAGLALSASLRCGVGLAAAASTAYVLDKIKARLWEPVYLTLPETEEGHISALGTETVLGFKRATAILAGCGLGVSRDGEELIRSILSADERPMVIDADGLNCLCRDFPVIGGKKSVVITPHMGEMSRLTGRDISYIKEKGAEVARDFALCHGVTVVLKGAVTYIASSDGKVYVHDRPNSGLSKGGSGDVLAGCIGSFLAQGVSAPEAALLGVLVHGGAGAICAEKMGKRSMLAGDIIDYIPQVLVHLENL